MLEKYLKARVTFIQFYDAARSAGAKKFWEKRIAWCEKKIKQTQARVREQEIRAALMKRLKLMVIIVNVAVILSIVGCNTAKGGLNLGGGIMKDLGWLMQETANNIQVEEK